MIAKFIDNAREDSLTASVFSHLLHLPSEVFWRILRQACYSKNLPDFPGEPELAPWPRWNPAGTENPGCVIPDLFIRFDAFDLIIEAKIKDDGTQDRSQWERELTAYMNEYGKEEKTIRMLAIGGIHSHQDVELTHEWHPTFTSGTPDEIDAREFKCSVHMCRWRDILLECQRMERELHETKYPSSRTFADLRIVKDLIELFASHGFVTVRWFDYLDFKAHLLSDSVNSQSRILQELRLPYKSL